jgi:murein DD-endopeptidase MepM/ murein hydrolase activator NlpD
MILFGSSRVLNHYYSDQKASIEAPTPSVISTAAQPAPPKIEETMLTLGNGGSIQKLLTGFGVNKDVALEIANTFSQYVAHKNLKAGQNFNVRYIRSDHGVEIESFHAQPSIDQKIIITKADGHYIGKAEQLQLTPVVHVFEGKVNSSFYSAALKAGVPTKLVQEAVDVLSYVVNFQHGIQTGASFKILCNALRNDKGDIVQIKQLRFVSLHTGGQDHKLFAFTQDGKVRFFNEKGESVARSLLQTPLNAAKLRVTSGFSSNRMHPLLGYCRAHKGVDFGAPTGTPVLAAGEGRVVSVGWNAGYGNLVHIRHSGGYETKYAHLKYINKNIRPGVMVSQRQVLGGVGMTGTATGPHLHFEVILNKRHINPMKVSALPSLKLTGVDLKKFEAIKSVTEQEMGSFIQTKAVVGL